MPTNTENLTPAGQPSGLSVITGSTSEDHRRLIAKAITAIPAYAEDLTPDKIKTALTTRESRMALRETLRDLSREAAAMRDWV